MPHTAQQREHATFPNCKHFQVRAVLCTMMIVWAIKRKQNILNSQHTKKECAKNINYMSATRNLRASIKCILCAPIKPHEARVFLACPILPRTKHTQNYSSLGRLWALGWGGAAFRMSAKRVHMQSRNGFGRACSAGFIVLLWQNCVVEKQLQN